MGLDFTLARHWPEQEHISCLDLDPSYGQPKEKKWFHAQKILTFSFWKAADFSYYYLNFCLSMDGQWMKMVKSSDQ